jgi:glycosyltransferase involved in cell wall biosynthesis
VDGNFVRILYLINGLGAGGAERSLAEMLPLLRAAGVAPTVVTLNRRQEGVERDVAAAGFDVRFLAASNWIGRILEVRRVIRSELPDVVHTTIFESDVVGRLAAAGTDSAVVTSLVNTSYDRARLRDPNVSRLKLSAVKYVDGWTARHLTEHFHAITEAVAAASVDALGLRRDRITVVPRGRDPRRLGTPDPQRRRAARKALGIADDCELVLNVGRQEFQKGQLDLLDAAEILAARRPEFKLLIAGRRGNASAELERVSSRPALSGRVHFLGHRDDVPELLAAADVFAFPSHYEGLGGSVIEAMALGLPIVTTAVPALLEVVESGENALVVPPGRPGQLAEALDALLEDADLRARLAARSRDVFTARFTLEKSVTRMLALYQHVAGRLPSDVGVPEASA